MSGATQSYVKSADEALLDSLTSSMGVANLLGFELDAELTKANRLVWVPDEWGESPPKVQPADGKAISEHARRYLVNVYAPTYGVLVSTFHALVRSLDAQLSRQSYEVGKGTPRGGNGGWGVSIPVVLKGPIYDRVYAPVVVQSVGFEIGVTGGAVTPDPTVLS